VEDIEMHFMVVWTFKPDHTKSTIARFNETGGAPPDGVKMVARWHDVSGSRGFAIAETDDAVAAAKWCHDWSDLLSFEVIPVLDDEQLVQVIGQ
jgi:hypothetical protein